MENAKRNESDLGLKSKTLSVCCAHEVVTKMKGDDMGGGKGQNDQPHSLEHRTGAIVQPPELNHFRTPGLCAHAEPIVIMEATTQYPTTQSTNPREVYFLASISRAPQSHFWFLNTCRLRDINKWSFIFFTNWSELPSGNRDPLTTGNSSDNPICYPHPHMQDNQNHLQYSVDTVSQRCCRVSW